MKKSSHPATILAHAGRPDSGPVNRPVHRASTVTFRSLASFRVAVAHDDWRTRFIYGRTGNPNSHDFEQTLAALEGGYGAVTGPSGIAVITSALQAFCRSGQHIMITDTCYYPTRTFADNCLRPNGVEVEYYDPAIGGGIEKLIRDNTALVYMESPGTKTYDIQDVSAIAAAAKKRDVVTMTDNTWATPLFFRPLDHGVDISLHAVTKYLGGHSDLTMGAAVCAEEKTYLKLKSQMYLTGQCASPDDLSLALRSLRSLGVRLERHQVSARIIIDWLSARPEVAKILYPALPQDPNYRLWRRDFTGANGLFTMILNPVGDEALARFVDGLEYFPLGFSWGGYESLMVPLGLEGERTVNPFKATGPAFRLHIGLEDPADLIADLEDGFARMKGAAS